MRDGIADSFIFRFSRLLDTRHVDYKIVLPAGFDAVHEPIGHLEPDVQLSIDNDRDQEGKQESSPCAPTLSRLARQSGSGLS